LIQLYPDPVDLILATGMVLDVGTAYLSFRIARISKYTPMGWYLITLALMLKIGRDGLSMMADLLSPVITLETATDSLYLVVSVVLFTGVFLLRRTFIELTTVSGTRSPTEEEP
jgi:hypothetical protein